MSIVYGLTFRGETPPTVRAEWATTRTWVTKKQLYKIMLDQDDPNRKGRTYWVGNRFFSIKDIAYAKPYDIDDPKVAIQLKKVTYLMEQLEKEKQEKKKSGQTFSN